MLINGVLFVSCVLIVVNYSFWRLLNSGDVLNVEVLVFYVSSIGIFEYVDFRNVIVNDIGLEMLVFFLYVLLWEVCIGIFFVVVMKCVFYFFF